MGDYWGACVPLAVRALPEVVPRNAEILINEPFDAAAIQYSRLREGLFSRIEGYGPYRLVHKTTDPAAYTIVYNRLGLNQRVFEAERAGRARILWRASMPPGDAACVIAQGSLPPR
jgi:hypothetical protein